MKDLGETKKILGMEINRNRSMADSGYHRRIMFSRWKGSTYLQQDRSHYSFCKSLQVILQSMPKRTRRRGWNFSSIIC